jgi:hypothetical protein
VSQVRRRRRPRRRVAVAAMCERKYQRRCPALLQLREEAVAEWTGAETYSDVCRVWGRLGGRVTLHRYGREHYRTLARRRRHLAPVR